MPSRSAAAAWVAFVLVAGVFAVFIIALIAVAFIAVADRDGVGAMVFGALALISTFIWTAAVLRAQPPQKP